MVRFAAVEGLAVRSWPLETVAAVFSAQTVRTLLVSEVAAAVLDLAGTRPVTCVEAAALLCTADQDLDFDALDVGADLALMEETITGLVAAGLLRRVE